MPILYNTFRHTRSHRSRFPHDALPDDALPVFLKHVLASPEAGNRVKKYIASEVYDLPRMEKYFTDEDLDRLRSALIPRCGSKDEVDEWFLEILHGNWGESNTPNSPQARWL
jgi:hypothetical protein